MISAGLYNSLLAIIPVRDHKTERLRYCPSYFLAQVRGKVHLGTASHFH